MLLEQCGQIVVACKRDQVVTGDRGPPLHLSHQRRQRCSNTANIGDNHLFHTDSVTCPNSGNHHYLDIPMGHFKIINYINSIIYYLFSNIIYLFSKIKSTDTMEPDLIAETPRSNDTVSWKIKSKNIKKFTNSKIQIQEPSQKSFVKTFSTSSNFCQSNPTMPQIYFRTMPQFHFDTMPQFYIFTMPQRYFATMLQYYNVIIQQYINATILACS